MRRAIGWVLIVLGILWLLFVGGCTWTFVEADKGVLQLAALIAIFSATPGLAMLGIGYALSRRKP